MKPKSTRARGPWFLEFILGCYFGTRYNPEDTEKVLAIVTNWGIDFPLKCHFLDLPVSEVTYERLAWVQQGIDDFVQLRPEDPEFRATLRSRFPDRIESVHLGSGRPLVVDPWVDEDDTVVYEIKLGLCDGEERFPPRRLVEITFGENNLLRALSQMDCMWASLEVSTPTPTLGSVLRG